MTDVKIGLETHLQLDTESKLFCSCANKQNEEPNTNVCPTCLGHPGSKPRTNKEVLKQAFKVCKALELDFNKKSEFARKTYFYPDMSKNYQITQYDKPVAQNGSFEIKIRDEKKQIGIKRLHIEEDPAKLIHEKNYCKVDYNRAGTPLLEIVTDPDLKSPEEARAYLQQLAQVLEYLGVYSPVSDYSIKSDANISINGGERVEIKNITGTSDIEKALNYELSRQKQLTKRNKAVKQHTRRYNPDMGSTVKMRDKETEEDYGYIYDPDLTVQNSSEAEQVDIPELPKEKHRRFTEEYGLKDKIAESLISDPGLAKTYEELSDSHDSQTTAVMLTGDLKKVLNYNELGYNESGLKTEWLSQLLQMIEEDGISDRNAEKALREVVEEPRPIKQIVEEKGLEKSGVDEVTQVVEEVIKAETQAVEDYQSGDESAINYLVGQVMQKTGGGADPKKTRELLIKHLE